MRAYEQMIRHTATSYAPWFVVPADQKWFTRLVVSSVIVDAMSSLRLHYPRVSRSRKRELAVARKELLRQKGKRRDH